MQVTPGATENYLGLYFHKRVEDGFVERATVVLFNENIPKRMATEIQQ